MKMASQTFFFLFSCALLLFHGVSGTLEENCKKIVGYGVTYESCMAAFQDIPNSKTADIPGLGVIAANSAITKAKALYTKIGGLLKTTVDTKVKRALQDCNKMYEDIVEDGSSVVQGFQTKDFGGANAHMSALLDTPDDCEKGFRELKVVSPLTNDNANFRKTMAVPLRISAVLLGM
ncbi:hypothetical protein ACHQM5_029071 [Ranunculus cassubicifolius]